MTQSGPFAESTVAWFEGSGGTGCPPGACCYSGCMRSINTFQFYFAATFEKAG